MAQLFINTVGFNAAGKTFVAEKLTDQFALNRISGDDFRRFVYDHIAHFASVNNSYPTVKNKELNPLVKNYRLELLWILLKAGQNIIFDGSGAKKDERFLYMQKIKKDFPAVKTVIIWVTVDEPELLKRLAERDKTSSAKWTDMYYEHRKPNFEPPKADEADILLTYNQTNYDEIQRKIAELIK